MEIKTHAIIDLTKVNVGGEIACAISAYRSMANLNVRLSDIILIIQPHQAKVESEFRDSRIQTVGHFSEVPNVVASILTQASSDAGQSLFMLFSYNGEVLRLAYRQWPNVQVVPTSFSRLRERTALLADGSTLGRSVAKTGWRFEHVVPLDEALAILLDVLWKNGYRSPDNALRQAMIRPLMGTDPRFRGSSAATGTVGIIKQLVAIAEARRLVSVDWTDSINPSIWVKEAPPVSTAGVTSHTAATPPVEEAEAPLQSLSMDPGNQQSREDADARKVVHRSRYLGAVLSKQNMGPYAEARPSMESAIEKHAGSGLSVDEMMSKALDDAKAGAGEIGQKQPWKSIERFYHRILLKWGGLLDDDGKPIKPGWESGSARVKSLAGNWRVLVDAAIIYKLVEHVDDISDNDIKDLARAVYRHQPGPDDTAKIRQAVAELLRQGLVEQIERGDLLVLRTKTAANAIEGGTQPERASLRLAK